MSDSSTPRLVYKGAPDSKGSYEQVETKAVADADALDAALKDGWRLQRVPAEAIPAAEQAAANAASPDEADEADDDASDAGSDAPAGNKPAKSKKKK